MAKIDLPENILSDISEKEIPVWINPMLAKLTHDYFSDPGWIYERKLDGERALLFCTEGEVKLMSRNKKNLNKKYPELVEAFSERNSTNMIIDGEIVAFSGNVTDFSKLQKRMHRKEKNKKSKIKVYYYAFDIIHIENKDLSAVPLKYRKKILRANVDFSHDQIRYLQHRNQKGAEFLREACKKKWEGLIAKDGKSAYVHSRSKKWLKFKCENQQELVIVGFTDPEGERIGFGALLVGYYDGDDLKYAGKVGTGYDDETLKWLHKKMKHLEIDDPPVKQKDIKEKNVHWIKPELVGEFQFTEWTEANKLRHPSFLGLRDDKEPENVVKEN